MVNFLLKLKFIIIIFLFVLFSSDTSEQHTYTSSKHFYLEEGETIRQKATKNFLAPGKNRTNELRILTYVVHSAGMVAYPI